MRRGGLPLSKDWLRSWQSSRRRTSGPGIRAVTLKTALTFGGFAVALALGVSLAGYGAGWQAGHTSALSASGALAGAIHQAGPEAESALVSMVRANNLGEAWAACQKSAIADKDGRRVCAMPMWADPERQPKG